MALCGLEHSGAGGGGCGVQIGGRCEVPTKGSSAAAAAAPRKSDVQPRTSMNVHAPRVEPVARSGPSVVLRVPELLPSRLCARCAPPSRWWRTWGARGGRACRALSAAFSRGVSLLPPTFSPAADRHTTQKSIVCPSTAWRCAARERARRRGAMRERLWGFRRDAARHAHRAGRRKSQAGWSRGTHRQLGKVVSEEPPSVEDCRAAACRCCGRSTLRLRDRSARSDGRYHAAARATSGPAR